MLIAKFENVNDIKWTHGTRAPNMAYNQTCLIIFVDGEELDYIKQHMVGIPMANDRQMVVITAPFADFVFKNLPR